jgi:peroxiredoxin (alkyl hydroperoxide reductase subunit C)
LEFNKNIVEFLDRDARVYGFSADSEFVHLAWRNSHDDLKNLQFPMVSDYNKSLCTELGILSKDIGAPLRATYIVDPDGVIQWFSVNSIHVGRNVEEILRTLDALQTGEFCQCNWKKGQKTLSNAA